MCFDRYRGMGRAGWAMLSCSRLSCAWVGVRMSRFTLLISGKDGVVYTVEEVMRVLGSQEVLNV